ncbi:hypothetical protein HU200_036497 [Digitaria exilis]|uniref:Uncharacterized protein n=1 Tax=Digitaria exilis TaxID=1010633 RepID=A0A835BPY4_9POAL|nr:hypothetical protein HU200_036497 [Digitaria exilis]
MTFAASDGVPPEVVIVGFRGASATGGASARRFLTTARSSAFVGTDKWRSRMTDADTVCHRGTPNSEQKRSSEAIADKQRLSLHMEEDAAAPPPRHGPRRGGVDEKTPAGAGTVAAEEEQWQKLGPEERRSLLERLVRVPVEDNGAFLAKIKQRLDSRSEVERMGRDDGAHRLGLATAHVR